MNRSRPKRSKRAKSKIKPIAKSFNCTSCGAVLSITAVGKTLSVACKSCHAIIDVNDPNYKILEKSHKASASHAPYIPIGAKGVFSGKVFECIGYMERGDGPYEWREYLLFSPYIGYRWLFEMDGHWTLLKKLHGQPDSLGNNTATYKSNEFKLFKKGTAKVLYVEGEFYWRVKSGDKSYVKDFIKPPYILSTEVIKNEVNWTFGKYIDAQTINKVFKIDKDLLYQHGVGANQPSDLAEKFNKQVKIALFALAYIFVIFLVRSKTAANEVIYEGAFQHRKTSYGSSSNFKRNEDNVTGIRKTVLTDSFYIPKKAGNLKISTKSSVYNSWIYIDALLVNKETGKGIPLATEVSYYRGSDWSEGGTSKAKHVYNVPAGNYYLNIRSRMPFHRRGYKDYTIVLRRDTLITSNLWVVGLLIIIVPFLSLFRKKSFEVRRWSNSDYSPYNYEED